MDYSRASNMKSAFQAAADSAALSGARLVPTSQSAAKAEAIAVFNANLSVSGIKFSGAPTITIEGTKSITVSGSQTMDAKLMGVVGAKTINVSFFSQAETEVASVDDLGPEIALVLDNTGSMEASMTGLKAAAHAFADRALKGSTRVAVVPFVTAVNVGAKTLSTAQLDTKAQSQWHGIFTRSLMEPKTRGSAYYPHAIFVAAGGCNYGSGGGGTTTNPGNGGKGAMLAPSRWNMEDALRAIFGISPAHAQSATVTPNTVPVLSGKTVSTGSYAKSPGSAFLPDGFQTGYDGCHLDAPDRVSHFDLLARIPGASWKGCVEARPEPFDVTDDAPVSGTPDSLFVPYFWPDEHDSNPSIPAPTNNYMSDGTILSGWERNWYGSQTANIFKYDGKNVANIVETAPDTSGPNKACPTEMLRLTNNKNSIKNAIDGMRHWNGGGTVLVEGLAWGWRAISPNKPLADGKPYGKDQKKTIVFMSDGANEIGDAPGTEYYSHYTSFGYLGTGRFPVAKFSDATKYLDERFLLACSNAKAKGIRIITVLFGDNSGKTASLMQQCASAGSDAYIATSTQALMTAFDKIGGQLAVPGKPTRLVR